MGPGFDSRLGHKKIVNLFGAGMPRENYWYSKWGGQRSVRYSTKSSSVTHRELSPHAYFKKLHGLHVSDYRNFWNDER